MTDREIIAAWLGRQAELYAGATKAKDRGALQTYDWARHMILHNWDLIESEVTPAEEASVLGSVSAQEWRDLYKGKAG